MSHRAIRSINRRPQPDPKLEPDVKVYNAGCGPLDGPTMFHDCPATIDVFADEAQRCWIGVAYRNGFISDAAGRAATFRLVIANSHLESFFVCIGRRFISVMDLLREQPPASLEQPQWPG